MNKKTMSFVLAAVLSVGLGVSGLFAADPYEKTGGTSGPTAVSSSTANSSGGFTMTIPDENKAAVGNVESKICAVFNYKAGMVISMMDQDRNVTIYSGGNPRATLGYNDDGTFTLTGFYLNGSDWDAISKMEGATDGDKLKNFLLKAGVQESALKASASDSSGNVNTDSQVDVAWFQTAAEQLKKGINYSVAIDLTATYGASMTWSVNGKQQETIGYDGTVLATYNYNAAGTLESVTQTTYETDDENIGSNSEVKYNKTTTTLYMDAYGRQSYATNSKGDVVTQYNYSSNGSISSVYSKTNNETTYYAAGKASYVLNDKGFKTAEYSYHANGSLNGITSYNYDQDNGGAVTKTQITAYKWGRAVGTADLSSGTGVKNFDELRAAVAEIKANPTAALNDLKAGAAGKTDSSNSSKYGNITSIALYQSDLGNAALMNFLGIDNATKNKMLAMSNGYSTVANAAITIDNLAYETETRNGGTVSRSGSFATYTDSNVTRAGVNGEQMSIKITVMDRGGASYQFNAACHTLRAAVNEIITNTTVKDPAVEGELWTPESEADLIAKAEELGIDVNDKQAMNDLRNGFYTVDGQTYAIVKANSVNIMDGNGFVAAEGETIMVAVDNATKNAIVSNVEKTGDRSIMFMGDVKESVSGYLTIEMNTNYGGGVVQGSAEVQAAKAEITETSMRVASAKYQYESGDMTKEEYDSIVKDADWVGTNTDANLQTFANGNFTWDQNKTARQNLEDAWNLLLNF